MAASRAAAISSQCGKRRAGSVSMDFLIAKGTPRGAIGMISCNTGSAFGA